jgi:4-diphosphocytidyl-2-C-methyl-D-erythritol kinase
MRLSLTERQYVGAGRALAGRIARVIHLLAAAKVNLAFEVLGKREDGFHEVRTVLQAIDLCDEVEVEAAREISLVVEPAGAVPVEGNLVLRAAEALREATGVAGGAAIRLRKRIPVAAGLGGGSSDAAATLLALRQLWDVDRDKSVIYRIAASLGSDVPFFLRGGTAVGSGRGDALELLPMPVERFAVVVTPVAGAEDATKTSRLYSLLEPRHFSDGSGAGAVIFRIVKGQPVGNALRNTFEQVAFSAHDSYEMMCTMFGTTEAGTTLLAGAGPSMFTLVDDEAVAERIAASMVSAGFEARVARLLGPWGSEGLAPGAPAS